MQHLTFYLLLIISFWGCHSTTSDKNIVVSDNVKKDTILARNAIDTFNYNWIDTLLYENNPDYLITKKCVGRICLGESIQSFKEKYKDFKIDVIDAWSYGIDGGGFGYEVSDKDNKLLFVWAQRDSSTIYGIHVVSPRYQTKDNIRPGMTIKDLIKRIPDYRLQLNLMTTSEFIEDTVKGLVYNFWSQNRTLIRVADGEDSMFTSVKNIKPKCLNRRISEIYL